MTPDLRHALSHHALANAMDTAVLTGESAGWAYARALPELIAVDRAYAIAAYAEHVRRLQDEQP